MTPLIITIVLAAAVMLVLAIFMALVLGWANKTFHVEVDPRIDAINEALPGANCGGCGYVGCNEYAEALVENEGEEDVNLCPVGGEACAEQIASILGVERGESLPYRPVVHCGATREQRLGRHEYHGRQTCASANLVAGVQSCTYGCLGFGDCVDACDYDAIHVVDGLATVDYDKCIGCGACAKVCPRNIVNMVPFKAENMVAISCSNKDFGKDVKGVCEVGCIGCKVCQRNSDLIEIQDNIPVIDYDQYDPEEMGRIAVALEKCPMKRLLKVGKPTPEDLEKLRDEELPEIVKDNFATTVDKTEWRG